MRGASKVLFCQPSSECVSHLCCRWCYTALIRGPWEKWQWLGLQSFHMQSQRRILGVKWYDKITNAAIKETGLTDLPSLIVDRRHSLFGHICRLSRDTPNILVYWIHLFLFTGTTSIHWCLHQHTSCHWLEAPAGPSTENLAPTGGRRYGSTQGVLYNSNCYRTPWSTHQCLSIRNLGPIVLGIAATLSRSSAAVSEWVSDANQSAVLMRQIVRLSVCP